MTWAEYRRAERRRMLRWWGAMLRRHGSMSAACRAARASRSTIHRMLGQYDALDLNPKRGRVGRPSREPSTERGRKERDRRLRKDLEHLSRNGKVQILNDAALCDDRRAATPNRGQAHAR